MNIKQHKNNNKTGHTKKTHNKRSAELQQDIRYIPNHTTALQAEHNNRSSAQEHNNVNDRNKYIYIVISIYI